MVRFGFQDAPEETRRGRRKLGNMLSEQDNELLTRVGPGTPMGELFRRFWTPVMLASEVPAGDGAPVRVNVLGEKLVAFRATDGRIGLLEAYCPHRRAN